MMDEFREDHALIHMAIHDKNATSVKLKDGSIFPVKLTSSKLRCIDWGGMRWIEQNPATGTDLAKAAIAGKKVTWGIRSGSWLLIVGDDPKDFTKLTSL
jgi:hypothetical protein